MKRFRLGVLVTLLGASLALGACTSPQPTPAPEAGKAPAEAAAPTTELRFSWWGSDNRHKATLDVINKYQAANPTVVIKGEYGGYDGYQQKLFTQLNSVTAPDIIQIDSPWLEEIVKQGKYVIDMTTSGIDISGFDPNFSKMNGTVNGTLYALPTGVSPYGLIVNTTLYEKAGLTINDNMTWDDFIANGKKLKVFNPKNYLITGNVPNIDYIIKTWMVQKTGKPWIDEDKTIGFTEAEATEMYEFLLSMFENNVLPPIDEIVTYNNDASQNPNWVNGNIGGTLDFVSAIGAFEKMAATQKFGTAPTPQMKDAKSSGVIVRPTQYLVVNANSKNLDAAKKFTDYFFNDEDSIEILGTVRGNPPTKKASEVLTKNNTLDTRIDKMVQLDMPISIAPETIYTSNSKIYEASHALIQEVAFKKTTPEAAAKKLIASFTVILKDL